LQVAPANSKTKTCKRACLPKRTADIKDAARKGGKIAGDARKALEKETGKKVISKQNYLPVDKKNQLKKK